MALLVCVSDARLGSSFLGRSLDLSLLQDLPFTADPAGEHGEYHSFVYNGPLFHFPVSFLIGEITRQHLASTANKATPDYDSTFWYLDLLPSPVSNG